MLVLLGVLFTIILAGLDNTIVSTIIPVALPELGGGHLYAWTFAAYMLAAAISMRSGVRARIDVYPPEKRGRALGAASTAWRSPLATDTASTPSPPNTSAKRSNIAPLTERCGSEVGPITERERIP